MKFDGRHPQATLALTYLVCEGGAFLRNLILARLIGPQEMGLAVALALGIRILEMAGDFGFERLLIQAEQAALPSLRGVVHFLQLAKGVCLVLLAVLLAQPLAQFVNPALDPDIYVIAAFSLMLRGAANCDFRQQQRHRNFRPALIVEGGSNVLATLAVAPIAWLTRDYTALAWGTLIQAFALCALSHIVAAHPISLQIHRPALVRCLRYGLPVALNGALMFVALQGDKLIVAVHFSAPELARFAIAAQLVLLPGLVGARYFLASELPRYAGLTGNHAASSAFLHHQLRLITVLAAGLSLTLALCGNWLIGLLYGTDYQVAPEIVSLFALAAGLRLLRAVPNTQLISQERTGTVLTSNVLRMLMVPVALFLAIQDHGLVAIVGVGVIGEALSLCYVLLVTLKPQYSTLRSDSQALPERS